MSIKPLLALLLAPLLLGQAYGGVPSVPSPTCVKWCGNETSGSKSSTKQSSKHHSSPMPVIDVGAMMDAAQAKKNKARQADMAAAKAAEATRLQQEAKQRAAQQAQQAAERADILKLSGELKGGMTIEAPNNITLKPIPPARSARSQLDCVANIKPDPNNLDAGAGNWENPSGGCAPITPVVPEPPLPTRVEDQAEQMANMLEGLMQQITSKREELTQLDQEITSREQAVAQESLKIISPEKGESDALRRAKEALEKARADRARTADELAKLEQQQTREQHRSGP